MATWSFANSNNSIAVTKNGTSITVSKYSRITMSVSEPILFFSYSENNPQQTSKINTREWQVDYTDVTSPVSASATALRTTLQGWIDNIGGSTPATHAASHQNGGSDEINVGGLSGLLADPQTVEVVKNSGAVVSTRKQLNFIEGSNVTLTIADDAGNSQTDITIAASAGGVSDGDKGDVVVSSSGTVWTVENYIKTNYAQKAYSAAGGVMLAEPIAGSYFQTTATLVLNTQQIRIVAAYLPYDATITGVKWYQVVQGNYTATNYNGVGLYSVSAGTMTLRASSTDDGNIWKAAANSIASKAFSSTYAATAGLYFIALLYNQSAQVAQPSIAAFPAGINNSTEALDFTNSVKFNGVITGTTLPSPTQVMSGVTATNNRAYAALY